MSLPEWENEDDVGGHLETLELLLGLGGRSHSPG